MTVARVSALLAVPRTRLHNFPDRKYASIDVGHFVSVIPLLVGVAQALGNCLQAECPGNHSSHMTWAAILTQTVLGTSPLAAARVHHAVWLLSNAAVILHLLVSARLLGRRTSVVAANVPYIARSCSQQRIVSVRGNQTNGIEANDSERIVTHHGARVSSRRLARVQSRIPISGTSCFAQ